MCACIDRVRVLKPAACACKLVWSGASAAATDSLRLPGCACQTMLYELSLAEAMGGLVKQRVEEPELADVPDEHRDGLE